MNSLSREPNVIYVGRKPPMNYVLAIITSFSGSNAKEVTLKVRGQAITTAVDAGEIARHRFMKELKSCYQEKAKVEQRWFQQSKSL